MPVSCLYVEKKQQYAVEAAGILADLRASLRLDSVTRVRVVNRYLLENISEEDLAASRDTILSEPQVDDVYDNLPPFGDAKVFAVEFLPGQFDQRADSCAQCVSLLSGGERPTVRCARIIALEGGLSDSDFAKVKAYLVNPVESREASLDIPETLAADYAAPADVAVLNGFTVMDGPALETLRKELGLAMDSADILFCQRYFAQDERRDPTMTELRVIDTYWSDHCRHTTFLTHLTDMDIGHGPAADSFRRYRELRDKLGIKKPVSLMDMATIGAKALKKEGLLDSLDQSDEINACSVNIQIDVDGEPQDWLLMFKNETHNHPTEIEPFGGAATCLGGAIRDPLSGRSFVYQAMRITGAANPLRDASGTRPGKLPQRKLCQTAAAGYSSYGNQIGLATGLVHETYHPGYEAKRMELGAVIGAAPRDSVIRKTPQPGDTVILLGGRTGRDGCGGATGSSKSHTAASLETCGSEVQKGNAPEERKIQRLFRNPDVTRLIRRCNDFGAGGVSVAVGELADGLNINLDAVPRKYEGLDGTELAISESQERMAVVVAPEDAGTFIRMAGAENLEATAIAEVTEEPALTMAWRGKTIVSLSREFLNSNGASKSAGVKITQPGRFPADMSPVNREAFLQKMPSLKYCSQKGLVERFDSTVGAGSVLLPFGGEHQLTPAQVMAAKFPVPHGDTKTCSLMSWAFDPERSDWSPYHAAIDAVIESVAKIIAAGGSRSRCWLTFQEFFERLGDDPEKWGKPAAAMLGALEAQLQLGVAAIGGKDSMSGTFEDISVPPTLVSLAVSVCDAGKVVSGEFKKAGSPVYLLAPGRMEDGLVSFDDVRSIFDRVENLISQGRIGAAWAVGSGGSAEAVCKMCFGNRIGFSAVKPLSWEGMPGAVLLEANAPIPELEKFLLGHTASDYTLATGGEVIGLDEVQAAWEETLRPVYPTAAADTGKVEAFTWNHAGNGVSAPLIKGQASAPLVAIPVFPGTNCEYDTARAFERAGAKTELFVLRNLTPAAVAESAAAFAELAGRCNIIAVPGGFSAGDEPEGSGKFITAFLRNPKIREQVELLINRRDGLMLGICNGFQALVKLGLLPFGEYRLPTPDLPTLTYNTIGRHQSKMIRTRIASNKSPWLSGMKPGDIYLVPVSHGEGRFIASEALIRELAGNGQIAAQYVDPAGMPCMDTDYNPNGSDFAIEAVTSPDGRILGKMAHNERYGEHLYRNLPPHEMLDIFSCAVRYFSI